MVREEGILHMPPKVLYTLLKADHLRMGIHLVKV